MIVDWCVLKIWSVEVLERIMLTSSSRFDANCYTICLGCRAFSSP